MKITKISIILILTSLLISRINGQEQSDNKTVSFESNIQKLADGFIFTEGPAADKEGNIYFTDGLPQFLVPVVMRVFHTHSPCLEEGGA